MPHRRTVIAAALVLLAWIAAPSAADFLLVPALSAPARSQTFEPKTDLVVITSDRPVVSVHPKRSDGRRTSVMTAAEASMASLLALSRRVRHPGPLLPDEPLAFSVVPRGPPSSITP